MRILILNGGLQGLSCGESLHEKHHVSIVATDMISTRSSYFEKVYVGINPNNESLFQLLKKEKYDVLLPVSDMTVPFISKNKAQIEKKYGVKCAVTDYEQVYQVEDKGRFMAFCEANDIPHPRTKRLSDDKLAETAAYVSFPALIKPNYSVGARGITRVNSLEELKMRYPQIHSQYGECSLQELIANEEYYYNVMLYRDKNGNFLSYAISKIVRMYPIHAGSSACLITVENEELLQICKDCLDKLGWVGMADFDVLQRLDNGEYKIIEINPRVPASLRAAAISGVNFPEIIVCDAMGEDIPKQNYTSGKILRYLGLDLMWFMKSPKRLETRPSWFKFFGENIYYQDIIKGDASTWWTWFVEGIKKVRKKKMRLR